MNEKAEALGQAIDRVDSMAHSIQMPMPAEFHVDALRSLLPGTVADLKAAFVALTGENPWKQS